MCLLVTWSLIFQIDQLRLTIAQAMRTAKSMQVQSENGNGSFLSWLGLGSGVDYQCESYVNNDIDDDFGGGESRKLEYHLESSINNLCNIFQVLIVFSDKLACAPDR